MTASLTLPVPMEWDLRSLWPEPGTDEFAGLFDDFLANVDALDKTAPELPAATPKTAATWGAFLEEFGAARQTWSSICSLVGCWAAGDAENVTYQQYEGRLAAVSPVWTRITLTIELAMRSLDGAAMEALVDGHETLASNRFFLEQLAKSGRFRLPRDQEELASELGVDGIGGWSRLYDRLSGEVRVQVMEAGELVEKSPGQIDFDQPTGEQRENNFRAFVKGWDTIAATCADTLNHMSGARLVKYGRLGVDVLDYPLRLNRLGRGTLDQMWRCVCDRKPILLDYLSTKAKWLDQDGLSWWDVGAPLPVRGAVAKLSYDDACQTVVETLGEFSGDFGTFSADALNRRWVEAADRPGKRQGGFCTDLSKHRESRIFMTYTGTPDSMATLAHELGHAYHSFVLRDEPPLLQDYPMNLAETASTFAEAVVGARRAADAVTEASRLGVLDGRCNDAVSYLMNIHSRFLFEQRYHDRRRDGELTVADFDELMLGAQREAFCSGLRDDGYYPRFWVSKLHFYIDGWPFYNFPYTFGYLLSLGLFTLGQQQPETFAENFRRFLVLTGCRETEEAVAESFGHDLTEPTFWNLALDTIEQTVEEYVAVSGRML